MFRYSALCMIYRLNQWHQLTSRVAYVPFFHKGLMLPLDHLPSH
jgi:hypothetical protein